jgi:hypothetical protein
MRTEQIGFRVSKPLLDTIDRVAREQLRTRTNMIEFMLRSWLRNNEDEEYGECLKQEGASEEEIILGIPPTPESTVSE